MEQAAAAEHAEAAKIKKAQRAVRKVENSEEDTSDEGDDEDTNPACPSLAIYCRSLTDHISSSSLVLLSQRQLLSRTGVGTARGLH